MADLSILDQMCFEGTSPCDKFLPAKIDARRCRDCTETILKHKKSAVSPEDALRAIELIQTAQPSLILPAIPAGEASGPLGPLLQGGVKAVSVAALRPHGIRAVVTAALKLEDFFPVFGRCVTEAAADGVTFLQLPWVDSIDQQLDPELLVQAVTFIHTARRQPHGVLVHCAQGKSRSSTCVLAYMLTVDPSLTVHTALEKLQLARKMAEPNPSFLKQLVRLHGEGFFQRIALP